MSQAILPRVVYSSEDEASSDEALSEWSVAADQIVFELDEELQAVPEEEEGQQVRVLMGRPKKRKTVVDPPIQFIPSQLKKKNGSDSDLALFDGEVYKRSQLPGTEGIQQWVCIKVKEGCKETMEMNRENECVGKSEGGHLHVTAKVDLDMRKFKSQIPLLALQDQSAPREIYSRLVENVSSKVMARANMLNTAAVINYHRRKRDGDPTTTTNAELMDIPQELPNYKGNLFVVFDSGPSNRRIIIFSTPALIEADEVEDCRQANCTTKETACGELQSGGDVRLFEKPGQFHCYGSVLNF